MGVKRKNLDRLVSLGFNVHEYKEINTYDELIEYSNINKQFTIRFDSIDEKNNLPFYMYDESINLNKELYFEKIIKQMNDLHCTLLCSNGYKYDNKLLFNFVIDIDKNNNFILELCSKKVPLRKMYEYKTTIIKGNIFDDYKNYSITNLKENEYKEKDIKKIIDVIIDNDLKIKYLEGTFYEDNVGILNNKIIFWQTNIF